MKKVILLIALFYLCTTLLLFSQVKKLKVIAERADIYNIIPLLPFVNSFFILTLKNFKILACQG